MKKTIIYFSLAFMAFTGVATANTSVSKISTEIRGNYSDNTPLAVAIMKGDIDAVRKFVKYGADVNERSNGLTPLMVAARYNRVEILNFLIENGARLRDADEKGNTALKYAQMSKATDAEEVIKKAISA